MYVSALTASVDTYRAFSSHYGNGDGGRDHGNYSTSQWTPSFSSMMGSTAARPLRRP